MDQDMVIGVFVETLNHLSNSDYRIMHRPDQQNRRSRDVDAYAVARNLPPLAIEHTSIESFSGQRRDTARFVNVLGPLEHELKGAFDFGLDLTIRIAAITTGIDWMHIRETTKAWLLKNSETLPLGQSRYIIPGVSFELSITKHRDTPGKVWIARFAPEKDETQKSLALAFATALQHKYSELGAYRRASATSVLIVESDDIALTSPATLYAACFVATRTFPSEDLDQTWLARTYESPTESSCHFHCFRGSDYLMRKANNPNAMFGPRYDRYWEQVVRSEPALRQATELLLAQVC